MSFVSAVCAVSSACMAMADVLVDALQFKICESEKCEKSADTDAGFSTSAAILAFGPHTISPSR